MDSAIQSTYQPREKSLEPKKRQVDSETWFLLIHEYLKQLFENPEKEKDLKFLRLESLASSIGRNVIERIADERLGKYRERSQIIRFIAVEVWTFLFGKMVTKVDYKEDGDTFYFQDNDFKFLRRISSEEDSAKEYISFCMNFIGYLIKAALKTFRIETVVTGETQNYADYTFMIQIKHA